MQWARKPLRAVEMSFSYLTIRSLVDFDLKERVNNLSGQVSFVL